MTETRIVSTITGQHAEAWVPAAGVSVGLGLGYGAGTQCAYFTPDEAREFIHAVHEAILEVEGA